MLEQILYFTAAAVAAGMALVVLLQGGRNLQSRLLAAGLLILGLEQVLTGFSLTSTSPAEQYRWQQVRVWITAAIPGLWLSLSVVFGRAEPEQSLRRWRWPVAASFVLPFSLLLWPWSTFYSSGPVILDNDQWGIVLGNRGYLFEVVFVLAVTFILANLETTLRNASGKVRWQIKFAIFGLGGFFAMRLYTSSQAILFSHWTTDQAILNVVALLAGLALLGLSLRRSERLDIDIYISDTLLYRSVTFVVVGIYLMTVGFLLRYVTTRGLSEHFSILLIYLALVILAAALFSDRLQQTAKGVLRKHLKRPAFDYRDVWTRFFRDTASLVETGELGRAVVNMVSELLESLSVSIWLLQSDRQKLDLLASTDPSLSLEQDTNEIGILSKLLLEGGGSLKVIDLMEKQPPVLEQGTIRKFFDEAGIRYVLPLVSEGEQLGALTVGERVRGRPLTPEEKELLVVIAGQTAARLLSSRLYSRLEEAREAEAFQSMSAFLVHDLKNIASQLSLTLQNMRLHFDNPEFREDALRVIAQSVEKIKNRSSRLTTLKDSMEISPQPADLNRLVTEVISELNVNGNIRTDLEKVRVFSFDQKQVKKVITNLVLNAIEASPEGAEIEVSTGQDREASTLTVRDQGCGMSRAFIQEKLFVPFQTTKNQGMGIGLYQSKMIVEKHGGRIEVESDLGVGSKFSVVLPSKEPVASSK